MQIIFHEAFHDSGYSEDPFDNAADPDRLQGIMAALRREAGYGITQAARATREDLLLGHAEAYVAAVEAKPALYPMAALAAGAAAQAAALAMTGEPAFACVRPPGHHAGRSQAWGHCTFSNVALALLKLRAERRIRSAMVVDFDQHTGDGTLELLRAWPEAQVFNGYGNNAAEYLRILDERLRAAAPVDILAVCAGFDAYKLDLGRLLDTEDYHKIGLLLKDYTLRLGHQRRFAVLEGGYYLPDLGSNVLAFCRGFQ
jgi:acetoin utilization deacetylase AcuC-like enzyme